MNTEENFKPKAHIPPNNFFNSIRFYIRLILDFQVVSVYRHLKIFLRKANGNLLDLGCGESPYRFLMNEKYIKYYGVDISEADKFDYQRTDITHFDGKKIPFDNDYFHYIICTEVLEHVKDYQTLVDEVYRVLKPNGKALFTIPWSARYHYIPYDYFRYTPSTLQKIFMKYKETEIIPRGTDVTSISSKLIILFFRNIFPTKIWRYAFFPFWFIITPLIFFAIIFGHISLLTKFGNDLDPIGYTILIKKCS
ncbi:MAG: class I SAM-dependent methyltransferase [Bacteroidota bacterium]